VKKLRKDNLAKEKGKKRNLKGLTWDTIKLPKKGREKIRVKTKQRV